MRLCYCDRCGAVFVAVVVGDSTDHSQDKDVTWYGRDHECLDGDLRSGYRNLETVKP